MVIEDSVEAGRIVKVKLSAQRRVSVQGDIHLLPAVGAIRER